MVFVNSVADFVSLCCFGFVLVVVCLGFGLVLVFVGVVVAFVWFVCLLLGWCMLLWIDGWFRFLLWFGYEFGGLFINRLLLLFVLLLALYLVVSCWFLVGIVSLCFWYCFVC